MQVAAWLGFILGIAVLLFTGSSVMKLLLIPRGVNAAVTSFVAWSVLAAFRAVTDRVPDQGRRQRILTAGAPTFLVVMLATWLVLLWLSFGLVMWPFTGNGLAGALKLSGSSEFTLGFAAPAGAAPVAIVYLAAAGGLVVIAMQIAYLPTLYSAFNRREVLVTMLEALAGNPPWGPELLARPALIGDIRNMPRLYERWTEWAADIAESHTTYRALIYFRSPDPARSWLLSLLAVLDAAALQLAVCPRSAPAEARPLLRVGYVTVRKLAHRLGLAVPDDPRPEDPVAISRAEFDQALDRLLEAGWSFERDADEAWRHFRGWRVNYEAAIHAMARFLDLPPAPWSGTRRPGWPADVPPKRPPHRTPASAETQ